MNTIRLWLLSLDILWRLAGYWPWLQKVLRWLDRHDGTDEAGA